MSVMFITLIIYWSLDWKDWNLKNKYVKFVCLYKIIYWSLDWKDWNGISFPINIFDYEKNYLLKPLLKGLKQWGLKLIPNRASINYLLKPWLKGLKRVTGVVFPSAFQTGNYLLKPWLKGLKPLNVFNESKKWS